SGRAPWPGSSCRSRDSPPGARARRWRRRRGACGWPRTGPSSPARCWPRGPAPRRPCPTTDALLAPGLLRSRPSPLQSDPEDEVALETLDARLAAEAHGRAELVAQEVHGVAHALGATGGQTPEGRAADRDHPGAPGEGLEHVGAPREPTVDDDV